MTTKNDLRGGGGVGLIYQYRNTDLYTVCIFQIRRCICCSVHRDQYVLYIILLILLQRMEAFLLEPLSAL